MVTRKTTYRKIYLVGGLEHGWIMTFHSAGNVIIQLTFIFFGGVGLNHQPVMVMTGGYWGMVPPWHRFHGI